MRKESPKAQIIGGKAACGCQRVEESPRRPFHLVFLFVHKKCIALTVPTIVIIRTNLLTAGVLCLTFVGSMRAQQSPAERVAEIQAALRFLNAE
jgi:hypothetical protein